MAVLLGVLVGGFWIGLAALRLQVEPSDGGDPYEVTVKSYINRFEIPSYQPGVRLPVVVDPADRSRVAVG